MGIHPKSSVSTSKRHKNLENLQKDIGYHFPSQRLLTLLHHFTVRKHKILSPVPDRSFLNAKLKQVPRLAVALGLFCTRFPGSNMPCFHVDTALPVRRLCEPLQTHLPQLNSLRSSTASIAVIYRSRLRVCFSLSPTQMTPPHRRRICSRSLELHSLSFSSYVPQVFVTFFFNQYPSA